MRSDPPSTGEVILVLRHHLGSDAKQPAEPPVTDRVDNFTAPALRRDEAAPAQAREMVGDAALPDTEFGNQLGHRVRPTEKEPRDSESRRISQSTEETRIGLVRCGRPIILEFLGRSFHTHCQMVPRGALSRVPRLRARQPCSRIAMDRQYGSSPTSHNPLTTAPGSSCGLGSGGRA